MLRLICATELSYIRFSFERNNTLEGQFLGVRVFTLGREVFFNGMQLSIEATNVEKQFKTIAGRNVTAIKDLNLSIPARDFLCIVGPSGSGKTTLLQLLAQLEEPTSGTIYFPEHVTYHGQIAYRNKPFQIGYVFQENALFPWMTVERNIAYPMKLKKISTKRRRERVVEILESLGLDSEQYMKKYPKELSGGEQKRVAIGMALASEANLLLLDEVTAHLDFQHKWNLQEIIQDLWMKQKITIVLTTHDIQEAIFLGKRVLIMDKGMKCGLIDIPFPRPRNDTHRQSANMHTIEQKIMNYFPSDGLRTKK